MLRSRPPRDIIPVGRGLRLGSTQYRDGGCDLARGGATRRGHRPTGQGRGTSRESCGRGSWNSWALCLDHTLAQIDI